MKKMQNWTWWVGQSPEQKKLEIEQHIAELEVLFKDSPAAPHILALLRLEAGKVHAKENTGQVGDGARDAQAVPRAEQTKKDVPLPEERPAQPNEQEAPATVYSLAEVSRLSQSSDIKSTDRSRLITLRGLMRDDGPDGFDPGWYTKEDLLKFQKDAMDPREMASWGVLIARMDDAQQLKVVRSKLDNPARKEEEVRQEINLSDYSEIDVDSLFARNQTNEELLKQYRQVVFKNAMLRPTVLDLYSAGEDGAYAAIGKTSSGDVVVVPVVPRFQTAQDFSHFANIYDCDNPSSGPVIIEKPAIFDKYGQLKSKGRLKIS